VERRRVQPTTFSPFLKNGEVISGAFTPMVRGVMRPRQRHVVGAGEGIVIGRMAAW
jgi:hypothetical protein